MKGEEAVRVSRGGQPRVKIGRELKRGGERLNPCQSFEGLAVFFFCKITRNADFLRIFGNCFAIGNNAELRNHLQV